VTFRPDQAPTGIPSAPPNARVEGPAPVAPAPAPSAPPPVPGPLAAQVAMRIAPLRLDADGVHRLTVNLHPVDLGPVQVVAEIRNGTINVQLSGSTEAGTDALRSAMDELRQELEQSGFGSTTLDLRQGPNQQEQPREQVRPGWDNGRGRPGPETASAAAPPTPAGPSTPDADGRLDVQA
jgi:flagellar hook-length control protein FliK